jgi:hypothetical protein
MIRAHGGLSDGDPDSLWARLTAETQMQIAKACRNGEHAKLCWVCRKCSAREDKRLWLFTSA